MKLVFSAMALCGLAACGGSSVGGAGGGADMSPQVPTLSQFETSVRSFGATADRIDLLTDTVPRNIPSSGTSTFAGPALLSVEGFTNSYAMTGDSRLTINFANDDMSGGVTNFRGVDETGRGVNVAGQIAFTDGLVGSDDTSGLFAVDFNGNLTAGSDRIALDGIAIGNFEGNRTSGNIRTRAIQAVSGTSGSFIVDQGFPPSMTATMNGNTAIADFAFVGEN
ncbi:hypothetical protein [Loktanella salsilacus]|uniref:hypothetical protein n=1 Tax=Loktanella salsilacus TaxID=195913 RepID=UPI0037360E54